MTKKTQIELIEKGIQSEKAGSAWRKGVNGFAEMLLEGLLMDNDNSGEAVDWLTFRAALLNGAKDWKAYSWGGCALICDEDIAKALCSPSELKATRNGQRRPNKSEKWLDTQARALYQAEQLIKKWF